jgi:chaperonin GroES
MGSHPRAAAWRRGNAKDTEAARGAAQAEANQKAQEARDSMKVRPLHDRLIVRRIEEKETVKGGIIIPDTAKEKPQEGEVIAAGNGKVLDNGTKLAMEVKKGDKILFGKYSGTDIKIDGEEYLILREDEVLAIVG